MAGTAFFALENTYECDVSVLLFIRLLPLLMAAHSFGHLVDRLVVWLNLWNNGVFTFAFDIANGHGGLNFVSAEDARDGRWLIAALFLNQSVTVQCTSARHLATIGSFLLKWFTQFEFDDGVLECRLGMEGIFVTVLDQIDDRCQLVGHFAGEETDA